MRVKFSDCMIAVRLRNRYLENSDM